MHSKAKPPTKSNEVMGPSLKSKRRFVEYFGSEMELLDKCDELIGCKLEGVKD